MPTPRLRFRVRTLVVVVALAAVVLAGVQTKPRWGHFVKMARSHAYAESLLRAMAETREETAMAFEEGAKLMDGHFRTSSDSSEVRCRCQKECGEASPRRRTRGPLEA